MKLLVIGDTHGKIDSAKRVIERLEGRLDGVLHLGDMQGDAKMLEAGYKGLIFHYVAGNCDYYSSLHSGLQEKKLIEFNGVKIFMTHGHLYSIKSDYKRLSEITRREGAAIAVCGHTHKPFNSVVDDILIVNPGSLSFPRGEGRAPTYAVLDISGDGTFEAGIVRYNTP